MLIINFQGETFDNFTHSSNNIPFHPGSSGFQVIVLSYVQKSTLNIPQVTQMDLKTKALTCSLLTIKAKISIRFELQFPRYTLFFRKCTE